MGLTTTSPVLELGPPSSKGSPFTLPWLLLAIAVSFAAIAIVSPMRSSSTRCLPITADLLQQALEHPEQHFFSIRMMQIGPQGVPVAPDCYTFTLVQGLQETGLPTRSVELVRADRDDEEFRTSVGAGRQTELVRRCLSFDDAIYLTGCNRGLLNPGSRVVRCSVQDAQGHIQAAGYIAEVSVNPAVRALFSHLDERMRRITMDIPDEDLSDHAKHLQSTVALSVRE